MLTTAPAAVVVMMIFEQAAFTLDEPVSKCLPEFASVTVRTPDGSQVPLMDDPGTRDRYSESTTVLGRLIEILSGQRFDTFLQTRIFTLLRMPDAGCYATPAPRPRLATVDAPGMKPVEVEALPFTEPPALPGEPWRVRLGRHRRHHLLERPRVEHRAVTADTELASHLVVSH